MKFITKDRLEVPSVTADQMKEIDRIAMEETGPNLFQMMENAGRSLCQLTLDQLGNNRATAKIMVLAGTGGNGGGGICAARHLANHGANVTVCITNAGNLLEIPAFQLHILKSTSARLITPDELLQEKPDIILDAIIGYSLSGEPAGNAKDMIIWAREQNIPIISLDVPSGINATTGDSSINHIKASSTLTLALPKTGLVPSYTGELYLADIGIPKKTYNKLNIPYIPPFDDLFYINIMTAKD